MAAGDNASSPELLPFVALLRAESALFTDWSSGKSSLHCKYQRNTNGKILAPH